MKIKHILFLFSCKYFGVLSREIQKQEDSISDPNPEIQVKSEQDRNPDLETVNDDSVEFYHDHEHNH